MLLQNETNNIFIRTNLFFIMKFTINFDINSISFHVYEIHLKMKKH